MRADTPTYDLARRSSVVENILTLNQDDISYSLALPARLHTTASQKWSEYTTSPSPSPTPSSPSELLLFFLGYLAQHPSAKQDKNTSELIYRLLDDFETSNLLESDIHTYAASLKCEDEGKRAMIKAYHDARLSTHRPLQRNETSIFQTPKEGRSMYVIFGGQGNTESYFGELTEAFETYPSVAEDLISRLERKLQSLIAEARAEQQFPYGLEVLEWLKKPDSQPSTDYLLSAPVSFPLIGLAQLVNYYVTCKIVGKTPWDVLSRFDGVSGHSQGIVVATAMATASTWEEFSRAAEMAVSILFFIGFRTQEIYPESSMSRDIAQDAEDNGDGQPTPMLNVVHLLNDQLQEQIDLANKHLSKDQQVSIALINGPRNFVVGGPPLSLHGLNTQLRGLKAPEGANQNRIVFKDRKPHLTTRFLPVLAPYHTSHLEDVMAIIEGDIQNHGMIVRPENLNIPVYHTETGQNLQEDLSDNLVPELVRMITTKVVDWPLATVFPGATHVLDFGPGGASGVGTLLQRNKDGQGVCVILATVLKGPNSNFGYKPSIFDSKVILPKSQKWANDFAPSLLRDASGRVIVDTRLSRLLGLPPVIIAGMTPTTVPFDFCAAAMNAGYYIELAAGGYFDAQALTKAIVQLEESIPAGRGVTLNLIYSSPRAIQWQIPLIRQLQVDGHYIEGITLGAGVPSLEVATEYIQTLGLKYISLKPGSVESIQAVISIAKSHPTFPVILQWTGGRGGGHHSYEDFHEPILQTYSKIRQCDNIVLVAGSGFGGSDDTFPYITGTWSSRFGYPNMPFDGCLFGSRMMVAKETHTSRAAKLAIANAAGVPDGQWHGTYKLPTGGIVTVQSEMGQPIHKIATRGVLLWAEFDRTLFKLDKAAMVAQLLKKREYIIEKLDQDYQKVWFGKDSSGKPVNLADMTYAEILVRLIELLYLETQARWIDESYTALVQDFVQRLEERLLASTAADPTLRFHTSHDFSQPAVVAASIMEDYPLAKTQLISAEDAIYFLMICRRPGQKPVPFIPVLDENFETWFKKDSLWQSENIEAVVDQDVQRTCILHGPVAAQYSNVSNIDEPVKDILDGIHEAHVEYLLQEHFGGSIDAVPSVQYFGGTESNVSVPANCEVFEDVAKGLTTYSISTSEDSELPNADAWLRMLGGKAKSWIRAFFTSKKIVQGKHLVANPMRRVFAPRHGISVDISSSGKMVMLREVTYPKPLVAVRIDSRGDIIVNMVSPLAGREYPPIMKCVFSYHPESGHATIQEEVEYRNDRIKQFYHSLWIGNQPYSNVTFNVAAHTVKGGIFTVTNEAISDFTRVIGRKAEEFVGRPGKVAVAPMDFGIVVSWSAIMKALLLVDGDLLKLVHLSNKFRILSKHNPLAARKHFESSAQITKVMVQETGKTVEVTATISEDRVPVMEVISSFFYRGLFTDFSESFQNLEEPVMEVSPTSAAEVELLTSRDWFHLNRSEAEVSLVGRKMVFQLKTSISYQTKDTYSSIQTTGNVLLEIPSSDKMIEIATIGHFVKGSLMNPILTNEVMDYLHRHGKVVDNKLPLANPVPQGDPEGINFTAPASNEAYAKVSTDHNPIHVSRVFASYADLPGPITHGMHTSAIVRGICDTWSNPTGSCKMTSYEASFCGMVRPGDEIEVFMNLTAMVEGRKIINIEARNKVTKEKVVVAECEMEQPSTAYFFTGQGSQVLKMGMDLYETSQSARELWDRADMHFSENYGFKISDIVRKNPKTLTVHFGGRRGALIRQNYLHLNSTYQAHLPPGSPVGQKFFDIHEHSRSYTYVSATGLLNSTEFTQPALTIMEKAMYDDMVSKNLVPENSTFAGHSLGEYSALAAVAHIMPIERLLSVVFYRGLSMKTSVERDAEGRSDFALVAINPSRISETFSVADLNTLINMIQQETNSLLEIVNHNVELQQYVCAGTLTTLAILGSAADQLFAHPSSFPTILEVIRAEIAKHASNTARITLQRGKATIPLIGIDVPFHSSYLHPHLPGFREVLLQNIQQSAIDPKKLIGRYVPNVTARPFEISKESFQHVYEITKSDRLAGVLERWEQDYAAGVKT